MEKKLKRKMRYINLIDTRARVCIFSALPIDSPEFMSNQCIHVGGDISIGAGQARQRQNAFHSIRLPKGHIQSGRFDQ